MNIYELEKRFDPKTGKEISPDWDLKEQRCDYCGDPIVHIEDRPYPLYHLDYDGLDGMFGAGGIEYQFGQDFMIEMHMFLSCHYKEGGAYAICLTCAQREDDVPTFYEEFAEMVTKRGPRYSFAEFLRESRVKAARSLLEAKEMEPYQLAGYEGEWPNE